MNTTPTTPVNTTMKTLAKVFIIIGMIVGCYLIVPLIVGIVALVKMKKQKPSILLSIVVLIFCSLIGGIFLLLSKEEEYVPAPVPAPAPVAAPADQENVPPQQ